MRKGLLLLLLVGLLVAMGTLVGAVAPIISNLPTVIIGDNEDVSGTTAGRLMRYNNVLNLGSASVINFMNGTANVDKHVWYTTSDSTDPLYKASNTTAFIDPMTTTEAAALEASGAEPAGGEITDGSFFYLSLMNQAINDVAGVPATDSYSADADVNGVDPATYPTDSYDLITETTFASSRTVTLYAADVTSFPTDPDLVAHDSFTVYSLTNSDDGGAELVWDADLTDTNAWKGIGSSNAGTTTTGWSGYYSQDDTNGVETDGSGLAFTFVEANTSSQAAYAGASTYVTAETMADPVVSASNMTGKIYHLVGTVTSTSVSRATSPAFRFCYTNLAYSHLGGAWVTALAGDDSAVTPSASTGVATVHAYWEVPLALTGYEDGGALATAGSNATIAAAITAKPLLTAGYTDDARDYVMQWDCIDSGTDAGTIKLTSLYVEKISTPAFESAAVTYGTGGTAFDNTAAPFTKTTDAAANTFEFGLGAATIAANTMEIQAVAASGTAGGGYADGSGYMKLAQTPANLGTAGTGLHWTANTLYKTTVTAHSNTTADLQCLGYWRVMQQFRLPGVDSYFALYQTDQYGAGYWRQWTNDAGGSGSFYACGTPKVAGSTVNAYLFGHDGYQGTTAETTTVYGMYWSYVDMYQDGGLTFTNWRNASNVIGKMTGKMTVTNIALDSMPFVP